MLTNFATTLQQDESGIGPQDIGLVDKIILTFGIQVSAFIHYAFSSWPCSASSAMRFLPSR